MNLVFIRNIVEVDNVTAMVCEMCGSNDIVKKDGIYVCQHCGTKYTVEEARKLLGTVRIDKTDETEKLLVLARRARSEENSENAAKYYGMVLQQNPDSWEANFFYTYYQAMNCRIIDITNAAISVACCIETTIQLISKIENIEEQDTALRMVVLYCGTIAELFSNAAKNHLSETASVENSLIDCSQRVVHAYMILSQMEKQLKIQFKEKSDLILSVQKLCVSYIENNARFFNKKSREEYLTRLSSEIKQIDSSYEVPTSNTGGCYIATAIYGSYDCPQVWTLRRFRDFTLSKTWYGRTFIQTYYMISPIFVKWFGNAEWFRGICKPFLDKMVRKLNSDGVENTFYIDIL